MKNKCTIFVFLFMLIALASKAQILIPKFEEPQKIEALSSEADESTLYPFQNGEKIYFYRTYIEGSGSEAVIKAEDIWYAERGNNSWKAPYRLFKSDYLDGLNAVIGTSKDGGRIYLYNSIYKKDTVERKLMYLDNKGKDKWTDPVDIEIPGLKFGEKYYNFNMNSAGDVLLISMSKSVSQLSEDLFVSLKQKSGKWGKIIDLGSNINSTGFEVSPYLADDKSTLYFASDRHGGMGAADIFVSYRLNDDWNKWSKPLNLGAPINSTGFDASFVMSTGREVFFTSDRNAEHINIYKAIFNGEFTYAISDSMKGEFLYKGLPADNISLEVYDEDGNFIDEIVTDAYGKFSYAKLDPDEVLLLKLAADDDNLYVGSKIYLTDENGNKTKRFIYTEDGEFVNADKITDVINVKGQFNYNNLPMDNVTMVVFDENGFPVDTLISDKEGSFTYSKLKYDNDFTIKPTGISDEDYDKLTLFLEDENGNRLYTQMSKDGEFVLKSSPEQLAILSGVELESTGNKDGKMSENSSILVSTYNGKTFENRAIFFKHNQKNIASNEKNKLEGLVKTLKEDKKLSVKLTGHTDNTGSGELNLRVGKMRANAVANYLKSKGVSSKQISIESKGMAAPIEPNTTESGKAKNRRVEIWMIG